MPSTETGHPDAPAAQLLRIVKGFWVTQALYVAAKLGIPDLLATGPQTSDALAQAVGAHPDSLHRLLRALTTVEVFQEREDGSFELLPMGDLLSSDSPNSFRSYTLFLGGYQWQTWGKLLESVQTGQSARTMVWGVTEFQHLERDPELASLFNEAMVELTRLISAAVVRSYDFSRFKHIVDVGGGYGELLRAILQANPEVHGTVFDMPHALEEGKRYLASAGLADRCEFISGDFFESVPAGADAYVLKSIIHDWNDEKARTILETCRRVMSSEAKLLLIERVLPERLGASPADQAVVHSDLNMMVSLAARERTEADFRNLLAEANLRLNKVTPVEGGFCVLEATVS